MSPFRSIALFLILTLAAAFSHAGNGVIRRAANPVPGQYLVLLDRSISRVECHVLLRPSQPFTAANFVA